MDQLWPNPKVQQAHFTGVQNLFAGKSDVAAVLKQMDQAYTQIASASGTGSGSRSGCAPFPRSTDEPTITCTDGVRSLSTGNGRRTGDI
jgi:hypothetical protein